ncbi:hypothetical protein BC941DRAFT_451351 [Chlamydoabsidia padenii]|nr:hypothetical protein BC941DRAFT_451351 [Chlamydoabsidia padenii]
MGKDLSEQLQDLSLEKEKKKLVKPSYDKAALLERWKILGKDAEQNILSAIRRSCFDTFARKNFGSTLQMIKHSFVDRDYEGIFTDPDNLNVYSAAYVPGRALCYFRIFCLPPLLKLLTKRTKIYAVGSGSGSELVSIAAAMTRVPGERQRIQLDMQDIGEWQHVLKQFEQHTARTWGISDEQLTCDVLDPTSTTAQSIASADLITFMFVMNELFVKKAQAMALIQTLVASMKKGAYLLVVESAGSFSHLQVGNKTYMVYTLLDAIPDFERILSGTGVVIN